MQVYPVQITWMKNDEEREKNKSSMNSIEICKKVFVLLTNERVDTALSNR